MEHNIPIESIEEYEILSEKISNKISFRILHYPLLFKSILNEL